MHSLSTAHLISAVCAVVVAAIAAGTTSIVSQTTTISITADHTVVTVVVIGIAVVTLPDGSTMQAANHVGTI